MSSFIAKLKGRTFLILSGIVVAWLILTIILTVSINAWKDHDSDVRSKIISGLTVTTTKDLAWQVKTDAGELVVQGEVTIPKDQCVGFSEMDGSICAGSVRKVKEVYTRHEQVYDCGTSKHPRSCTRVYWTWDYAGEDQVDASKAKILGMTMPYGYLRPGLSDVSPAAIGIHGCMTRYCYGGFANHTRYSYEYVPSSYSGVAFLDAEASGLGSFTGFDEGATANSVKNDALHPSAAPGVVFWIVEVLLLAGAGVVGYFIVRSDVDDGNDDGF